MQSQRTARASHFKEVLELVLFLVCPVLFGLMGIDRPRRFVQACCGGRASVFSCWDPRPMGLGRGLAQVTRSGQDRTQGIRVQDCGSQVPFVPSVMSFPAGLVL